MESFNLEYLQNRHPQPSYDICEQYKRFNCRHGKNGLTEVNGDICHKLHPKKCFKWIRAGKDESRGCNNEIDCPYYHPILCRNSVRYKKCLKSECTYTHLQGTKRYERPKTERNDHLSYHRSQEEQQPNGHHRSQAEQQPNGHNKPPIPWDDHKMCKDNTLPENTGSNGANTSFLEDLIQQVRLDMKKVQEELEEVRKSQESNVSQQQTPQYINVPQYMYSMPNQLHHTQPNPNAQTMQLTSQPVLPPYPRISFV